MTQIAHKAFSFSWASRCSVAMQVSALVTSKGLSGRRCNYTPLRFVGTCSATKTTRKGQPFAVTWHAISGRDYQSSWLLKWLAELADLRSQHSKCKAPQAGPDFLFLNCTLSQPTIFSVAIASYDTTFLHLRWLAQCAGFLGLEVLDPWEARELTKTTVL